MEHRRQERAHMSQREQREGHRRQGKLHMSSQCHRNVLPIFFNDKNYRLFGEYLTNTLWGYTISVKIMHNSGSRLRNLLNRFLMFIMSNM